MNGIYLEIRTIDDLISFLAEAKKSGMLKDVSLDEVKRRIGEKDFPLRIPVDLSGVLKVAENPVIRKVFGKKIEDRTKLYLTKAMEAK